MEKYYEKNSKIIYCVFCGEKNNIEDLKCKKCKKKLNPKNHLFYDYVSEHVKDNFKEDVRDSIFSAIKAWIISHLYGTFFNVFLMFSAILICSRLINVNSIKKQIDIKEVSTKPILLEKCDNKELIDQTKICDEGYNLEGEECIKRNYTPALSNTVCQNNYYLSNNYCISNFTVDKNKIITCGNDYTVREEIRVMGTYQQGDGCYVKYCLDELDASYYHGHWQDDGTCNNRRDISYDPTISYACNGWEDGSGGCHSVVGPTTNYSCSEGNLVNNQCETIEKKEYILVCSDGYKYNEHCKKCEKVVE